MENSSSKYSYIHGDNGEIIGLADPVTKKRYRCFPRFPGSKDLICVAEKPRPDDDAPLSDDRLIVVFDEKTGEANVYPENNIQS